MVGLLFSCCGRLAILLDFSSFSCRFLGLAMGKFRGCLAGGIGRFKSGKGTVVLHAPVMANFLGLLSFLVKLLFCNSTPDCCGANFN